MPIYEYLCEKCGRTFEHLHRTSRETAPDCPECSSPKVKKQFSTFSAAVATSRTEQAPCGAAAACDPGQCASGKCPFAG